MARTLTAVLVTAAVLGNCPAAWAQTAPERVEVNLVLIDVVVRDRRDRPVPGLRREDFLLHVDGHAVPPESFGSFEEFCPAASPPGPERESSAPEVVPELAAASPPAGHVVLFLDFTQMDFSARQITLKSALRFLREGGGELPPTMIQAFIRGSREVLEPFTNDTERLAKRLEALFRDRGTVDLDIVEEPDRMERVHNTPMPARLDLAQAFALEERERARLSLEALDAALEPLAGLRGRKALVLFSSRLRAEPGIQYLAQAGRTSAMVGDIHSEMLALARRANAFGVSFYTVHAGGMEDGSEDMIRVRGLAAMSLAPYVRTGIDSAIGLQVTLARETGGLALHNTNDPGTILGAAERDLSCFYVLGYRFESQGDGGRHEIRVKVDPVGDRKPPGRLYVRHRPWFTDAARSPGTP